MPNVVTLDQAKAHLRAQGTITTTADETQLTTLINLAEDAVERCLDRWLWSRSTTETHRLDSPMRSIRLRRSPATSVASVVVDGNTAASTGWWLDPDVGLVYTDAGWPTGTRGVAVVTYTAGYATAPLTAVGVILDTVSQVWQKTQQLPHPSLDQLGVDTLQTAQTITAGRVREAFDSLRAPGFA